MYAIKEKVCMLYSQNNVAFCFVSAKKSYRRGSANGSTWSSSSFKSLRGFKGPSSNVWGRREKTCKVSVATTV